MTPFLEFLVTLAKALAGVLGILVAGFLLVLIFGRVSDKLRGARRDIGEIVSGVMMLLVGSLFFRSRRSALLYHTPLHYKGSSMYPWQAIVGGGLCGVIGLCLVVHGIYRTNRSRGNS